MIDEILKRATQKYLDNKRNYYHYKDLYEEYYNTSNSNITKKEIQEITVKMQHAFDKIEELTYIFGRKYINEIRGE